jgi:putative endonuclease
MVGVLSLNKGLLPFGSFCTSCFFAMMITVYVIRSLDGSRYTGISKDVNIRLAEHNSGRNRYTKAHMPWAIEYVEQHEGWQQAREREKYLKSAAGKRWLQSRM